MDTTSGKTRGFLPIFVAVLVTLIGCGTPERASDDGSIEFHAMVPRAGGVTHNLAATNDSWSPLTLIGDTKTPRGLVDAIISELNGKLDACEVVVDRVETMQANGRVGYFVHAIYTGGTNSEQWRFEAVRGMHPDSLADGLLQHIPQFAMRGCRLVTQATYEHLHNLPHNLAGEPQRHVDQIVPELNKNLDCTIASVGTPGDADADGNFRFYLDATYKDGTKADKVHFETNFNNAIAAEVTEFLGLIPSRAFTKCVKKDPQVDPELAATKQFIGQVIAKLNTDKLKDCTINQPRDPEKAASPRYAYYLGASYPDGSSDSQVRFETDRAAGVDGEVTKLLQQIPSTLFRKCKPREVEPDVRIEQAKTFVRAVVYQLNTKVEQCTIIQIGDIEGMDASSNFNYRINALYPDGSSDTERRLYTVLGKSQDQEVATIIGQIPASLFSRCRLKGGVDPAKIEQARRLVNAAVYQLNQKLEQCTIAKQGDIEGMEASGGFRYRLNANYADGSTDTERTLNGTLNRSAEQEVDLLLQSIPTSMFTRCKLKGQADPRLEQAKQKIRTLVSTLNTKLEQCMLGQEGDPEGPDVGGKFNYYLNASYPDGSTDQRQRMTTDPTRSVEQEWDEILRRIPGQIFSRCKLKQEGPNLEEYRKHVNMIIVGLNLKLDQCLINRSGDVERPGSDGKAAFYLNAAYPDGTEDTRRVFYTQLTSVVEREVTDILTLIPGQAFTRCKLRSVPPPETDGRRHILAFMPAVNQRLEGCRLGISGNVGAVDSHGDFIFYLTALYDDGAFADPVRFAANVNAAYDSEARVLLRLIPDIEFKRCRQK